MNILHNVADIEDAMADVINAPSYANILAEYRRLLKIMGNVDGDEIVALVIVAELNPKKAK